MSPQLALLVLGPARHGVVIAAESTAAEICRLGGSAGRRVVTVLRADGPSALLAKPSWLQQARAADVVGVHFCDGLFGEDCAQSATNFEALAAALGSARISVTLHDVPDPADDRARYARRTAAYRRVIAASRGAIIVSSRHEATLLGAFSEVGAVVIPLPVARPALSPDRPKRVSEVGILGFIYPGKGHDVALEALDGLPDSVGLTALGCASAGHEAMLTDLRNSAARRGRRFSVTGYLEPTQLHRRAREVAIPLAAQSSISASASINSWLSAGRRPLVPDSPYTRELNERMPGALTIYQRSSAGLAKALETAWDEPVSTWLTADVPLEPTSSQVAAAYHATLFDEVAL